MNGSNSWLICTIFQKPPNYHKPNNIKLHPKATKKSAKCPGNVKNKEKKKLQEEKETSFDYLIECLQIQ